MNVSSLRRTLALLLPAAVLLTVLTALIYVAVQQVYRTSANDPQYALATDAARRLDAGARPRAVARGPSIDLAHSYSPHITVFSTGGKVLASTARLSGSIPVPPSGVLNTAQRTKPNLLTWQPRTGVRVAAVVVRWRGGTVLVGRSLSLVESRESDLRNLLGVGWLIGLIALALTSVAAALIWPTPLRSTD